MNLLPLAPMPRSIRLHSVPDHDNIWGRRTSILPSLSWKKSSEVEIVLDGEEEFIHSYSTFDEITGHVNLKFAKDTCIDDLAIAFQGATNTWIEKLATTTPTTGRTTGKHTFLRVQQPIDQSKLPEYNLARAGETYSIPFKFVVPDKVLDFICSHVVESESIRECHLKLPPSLGDPMLSGQANTLMDDLTPNMARISYSIRVGLLKASPTVRKPELVQEERGIRIVPARDEAPPISLDLLPDRFPNKYCLRKEKNVRKGILKIGKRQGRLTAESFQPASLKLHNPSSKSTEPVTTTTTVQLRFDPASIDEQPPALNSITSKLRVHTFYGAAPWSYFPSPEGYDIWSTMHSQYPFSLDLSSRSLSNVEWTRHEPGSPTSTQASVDSAATNPKVAIPSAYARRPSKAVSTHSTGAPSTKSTVQDNIFSRRASTFSTLSSISSTSGNTDESTSCSSTHSPSQSSTNLPPPLATPITPSTSYDPKLPHYTASILVPITLPTTFASSTPHVTQPGDPNQNQNPNPNTSSRSRSKPTVFLPTFYSCLISRIYSLDLSLHASSTSTITLKLPIQLSLPYARAAPDAPPQFNAIDTSHSDVGDMMRSAPPAWFDPFDSNAGTGDAEQMAADEALARALSQTNYPSDTTTTNTNPDADAAPMYAPPSHPPPRTRHASLPLLSSNHQYHQNTQSVIPTPSSPSADLPPEYSMHASFRRVSAARRANLSSSQSQSTSTSQSQSQTPSTAAASDPPRPPRRGSSSRFSLLPLLPQIQRRDTADDGNEEGSSSGGGGGSGERRNSNGKGERRRFSLISRS